MMGLATPIRGRLLPVGTTADAGVLLRARAVRAFGDGFVSVLLPLHLANLGLDTLRIGAIATATLVGSAALTLFVGLVAHRFPRRALLIRASLLMTATGVGFAFIGDFWPLLIVAFVGTLNPSAGDVSVFLPTEQALLSQAAGAPHRTTLFARYNVVGSLVAAIGALAAGLPDVVANRTGLGLETTLRGMFLLYALLGLVVLRLYRDLPPAVESAASISGRPLEQSRRVVYTLAALFSLDSFAGGFVVQSLLALWLFERFDLSIATAGTIFFWSGLLSALSQLAAPRLAARVGLINCMVFTHLLANGFLVLAAFMPTLPLAIACLLARATLSQMDVPARQSYVMAVVVPEERAAAASVTNVPRSLAAAAGPLPAGWLLGLSTFGWPLVVAGVGKAIYDLLLLCMFRHAPPTEDMTPSPAVREAQM
ncbi:MAG: MFS transporter [Chloroflexota bacterium]|nr:MFS transporter [Chloroflexota bacterium]